MTAFSLSGSFQDPQLQKNQSPDFTGGEQSGVAQVIPDIDKGVINHLAKWHFAGVYIRCVSCGEGQRASQSTEPFVHYSKCSRQTSEGQFPWRDFRRLLSFLPE
jgi:hypothetical protein